jgi:hypothetical protein
VKNNISNKPGTGSKQEFEKVESGIYRQKSNGCYYKRPHINGRRTWRSLGTQNLKLAREEYYKRRVKGQIAYAPKNAVATGAVIRCYEQDGFRCAIIAAAASIVVIHNHPSGESAPSEADIKVTRDLIRAGQLLKIELIDHVVIGNQNHSSLRELGYFL